MTRSLLFVLSAFFAIFTSSCLESPLLRHADASPQQDIPPLADCAYRFEKADLCATHEWIRMPNESEKGLFQIRFWNPKTGSANGPFVDPEHSVFVKLWMPDMGHGSSPVTVTATVGSDGSVLPGVFDASDVYFVMGGHWEIWIQLRDGTILFDQAKTDLSIE